MSSTLFPGHSILVSQDRALWCMQLVTCLGTLLRDRAQGGSQVTGLR